MSTLSIPREILDDMVAHAREGLPDEVCGMLAGRGSEAITHYRLNNDNPSPVSYSVDPTQQLNVLRNIESSGLELVGIYHSHPDSPPLPSITDINRAFFPGTRELNYPHAVYVIIGLSGPSPEVKAYRIGQADIEQVEIKIK